MVHTRLPVAALLLLAPPLFAEPTLVLHHGKVWTANAAHPWVQAIAIEKNRITFTGDSETALTARGNSRSLRNGQTPPEEQRA